MDSEKEVKEKYCIPTLHRSLLLALLKFAVALFEKHNIKYFADSGTMLGAVREGGQIPHDDDVDLGLLSSEYYKAKKVLSQLVDPKVTVSGVEYPVHKELDKYSCLMKIYVPNLWVNSIHGVITATPTVDFFSFSKNGNKYQYDSVLTRRQFSKYYFLKHELLPLKKYKFEDIEIWVANDPIPCLKRYYGEDCMSVVRIDRRKDEGDPMQKDRESVSVSL